MIHMGLGETAQARDELATAVSINPHFSALAAPLGRAALDRLGSVS